MSAVSGSHDKPRRADMKRYVVFPILTAAMIVIYAASANAQSLRTWVASIPAGGDDVNLCTRTAPCRTFAGAISKTAAGGEINCVDADSFGAVTITKSITIDCSGGFGGIVANLSNGIVVNA